MNQPKQTRRNIFILNQFLKQIMYLMFFFFFFFRRLLEIYSIFDVLFQANYKNRRDKKCYLFVCWRISCTVSKRNQKLQTRLLTIIHAMHIVAELTSLHLAYETGNAILGKPQTPMRHGMQLGHFPKNYSTPKKFIYSFV